MNLREKEQELQKIAQEIEKCQKCALYNRFAKTPSSQDGDVGKVRFQASPPLDSKAVESFGKKTPSFQGGEAYKRASRGVPGEKVNFVREQ